MLLPEHDLLVYKSLGVIHDAVHESKDGKYAADNSKHRCDKLV